MNELVTGAIHDRIDLLMGFFKKLFGNVQNDLKAFHREQSFLVDKENAEKGDAESMWKVAKHHLWVAQEESNNPSHHWHAEEHMKQAASWLRKAADNNHAAAKRHLHLMLINQLARDGRVEAQYEYGKACIDGEIGQGQSFIDEGLKYLNLAAQQGCNKSKQLIDSIKKE